MLAVGNDSNFEPTPIAVVFGGHQYQAGDRVYEEAIAVGKLLVLAGYSVRTGGYGGLMEAVSKGSAEAGQPAEGVGLANWTHESRNSHVPVGHFIESQSIFERTERLLEGAQLLLALPGSVGTLGEFFLGWTCHLMGMLPASCRIVLMGSGWPILLEVLSNHFSVSASKTTNIDLCSTVDELGNVLSPQGIGSANQNVERKRWDERARSWDAEILSPSHYSQADCGYARFDIFLKKTLDKRYRPETRIETLDIGCGTGAATQALLKHVPEGMSLVLDGLDFSTEMLAVAQGKSIYRNLISENLSSLQLPNLGYDLIFSRGVVFSRFDPLRLEQIFKHLGKVLRPGGILVFDFLNRLWSDPVASTGKLHLSCNDLERLLERAGLRVTDADGLAYRTMNIACTPISVAK